MNKYVAIDVGILDLPKTFDKVPYGRFALKLDYYGIRGNKLAWLQSFLGIELNKL